MPITRVIETVDVLEDGGFGLAAGLSRPARGSVGGLCQVVTLAGQPIFKITAPSSHRLQPLPRHQRQQFQRSPAWLFLAA
jgi:hypothetical protein